MFSDVGCCFDGPCVVLVTGPQHDWWSLDFINVVDVCRVFLMKLLFFFYLSVNVHEVFWLGASRGLARVLLCAWLCAEVLPSCRTRGH